MFIVKRYHLNRLCNWTGSRDWSYYKIISSMQNEISECACNFNFKFINIKPYHWCLIVQKSHCAPSLHILKSKSFIFSPFNLFVLLAVRYFVSFEIPEILSHKQNIFKLTFSVTLGILPVTKHWNTPPVNAYQFLCGFH